MTTKTRTMVVSLILVAGLAGGFFIIKNKQAKIIDSDNDGLSDQEEKIYSTDPNNPDTDNDGYLDGEEIASGYDPLKPAPNDELGQKAMEPRPEPGALEIVPGTTIGRTDFGNNTTNNNLTENLAANLAQIVLSSPDQNLLETAEGQEKLEQAISATLTDSEDLLVLPEISDEEIIISDDNSQEAQEIYLLTVMGILESALEKLPPEEFEIQIAQKAVEENDFTELDKYISAYKEIIKQLKQVPTPLDWIEIQKEQLGLFAVTQEILEVIRNSHNDPIKAGIAADKYSVIIEQIAKLVIKIRNLIEK